MPAPGTFLPCNDLFDWWTLRCSVWIVFLLALLGNGCVVIVLVSSRGKMDVPRFEYFHYYLMCLANHELSCQSNSFEFSYFTLIKSQTVVSQSLYTDLNLRCMIWVRILDGTYYNLFPNSNTFKVWNLLLSILFFKFFNILEI